MFNEKDFEVKSEEYFDLGQKTNICLLTLANGMEVVGITFNRIRENGHKQAAENAIDRLHKVIEKIKKNG